MTDPAPTGSETRIDWEGRYRDGATGWERPGLHPAFVTWLEGGAFERCRILVPGAGRSPEPLALAEAGCDVTVVDLAESAVAVQRARLQRVQVRARVVHADLLRWEPEAAFDAVYDQTCLCALPPALWPDYVARLQRWITPTGRYFVLFMQTGSAGGPPFDCPLSAMRELFPEASWAWPATVPEPVDHPMGRAEVPMILQRRG